MKSDVYFSKIKSNDGKGRQDALARILDAAGPVLNYNNNEIVPVKITIGDSQCVYHLRPDMVKPVIALLKKKNARQLRASIPELIPR